MKKVNEYFKNYVVEEVEQELEKQAERIENERLYDNGWGY